MKPLERLLFAQGGHCFFCDEPLTIGEASVEHLFASANGGPNTDQNCVACCKALNSLLGRMSLKEKFQVILKQGGKFKCPNGTSKVSAKPAPSLESATAPAKPDAFGTIVANLIQRGPSKPRTLKTLVGTVKTLLPKTAVESDVTAAVDHLRSTGKISIENGKVTYNL
jgi:hypothetical protein